MQIVYKPCYCVLLNKNRQTLSNSHSRFNLRISDKTNKKSDTSVFTTYPHPKTLVTKSRQVKTQSREGNKILLVYNKQVLPSFNTFSEYKYKKNTAPSFSVYAGIIYCY